MWAKSYAAGQSMTCNDQSETSNDPTSALLGIHLAKRNENVGPQRLVTECGQQLSL